MLLYNHLILGKVMTMRRYTLIGLCTLVGLMADEGFAQESVRILNTDGSSQDIDLVDV